MTIKILYKKTELMIIENKIGLPLNLNKKKLFDLIYGDYYDFKILEVNGISSYDIPQRIIDCLKSPVLETIRRFFARPVKDIFKDYAPID